MTHEKAFTSHPFQNYSDSSQHDVFDYDTAFSRNLGWLTESEQQILRQKRVAIAGLGGVGGIHLHTLARLGVAKFHLADYDHFELPNINRQANAFVSTAGQPKASVAERIAKDINPECEISAFEDGINENNIDTFLKNVDLFIDALDFFVMDIRERIYKKAYERDIPSIVAGPLGLGTAFLYFLPQRMTFEEYFRLDGEPDQRKYIKFMLGLAPRGLHRSALVDSSRVNFQAHKGPSTAMACQLCAGVAATQAMKLLLGRGPLKPAPYYHQFDPYRERYVVGFCPGGNANPLRRVKVHLAGKWIDRLSARARPEEDTLPEDAPVSVKVLDGARWAPSGDNAQPWRFEEVQAHRFRIRLLGHGDNIYQFAGGRPNLLAFGGLLEAVALEAGRYGYAPDWTLENASGDPAATVTLRHRQAISASPYAALLRSRSVDRGRYLRTPLTAQQKTLLELAAGEEYELLWIEAADKRRAMARLNAKAAALRMSLPECHRVHQDALDTQSPFSRSGLPLESLRLDPLTTRIMRWAVESWKRAKVLNNLLAGKHWVAWQMDHRPSVDCAAHVALIRRDRSRPATSADWVQAGRAMLRFWLEAERLGLVLQPQFAALCFAYYAKHGLEFSEHRTAMRRARAILGRFESLCGQPDDVAFVGRIGLPRRRFAASRSLRRPLKTLLRP